MKLALVVTLVLSICANVWLYYLWQSTVVFPPETNQVAPVKTTENNTASAASFSKPMDTPIKTHPTTELDLTTLKTMLSEGRFSELRFQLQQRLRQQPNNIELLLLEAELMMKTEPLNDALLHYYSLLRRPLTSQTRERIQQRIKQLLQHTINELKDAQSWDLLAQFLEPLFQQLPSNKQIILTLAEAYGQQRKFTLMEDTLASLSPLDTQVEALRQRIQAKEEPKRDEFVQEQDFNDNDYHTIPLQRQGDHYLIEVVFGRISTTLLVDTGATTTAVSQQVMNAISSQQNTKLIGIFNMHTAAGVIESEMNQVFDVFMGEFSFPQLNVMTLHNASMSKADGLLGMNVLRHFEFRIDQQRSVLLLKLHNRGS